jgi:hypothetical protein
VTERGPVESDHTFAAPAGTLSVDETQKMVKMRRQYDGRAAGTLLTAHIEGRTVCRLCLCYFIAIQAQVAFVVLTLLAFFAGLPSTGMACTACCTGVKTFSSSDE